jgi:hypothetical protein
LNVAETKIAFAALNATDVVPMEAGAFAEGCLSQSELTTSLSDGCPEGAAQRDINAARFRASFCGVRLLVHTIGVIHLDCRDRDLDPERI